MQAIRLSLRAGGQSAACFSSYVERIVLGALDGLFACVVSSFFLSLPEDKGSSWGEMVWTQRDARI